MVEVFTPYGIILSIRPMSCYRGNGFSIKNKVPLLGDSKFLEFHFLSFIF
jgi:hypothetical protein